MNRFIIIVNICTAVLAVSAVTASSASAVPLPFFAITATFEIEGPATEYKTANGKEIKCNNTEFSKGGEVTTPESKALKRMSGRFVGCVIAGTTKECKTPTKNPKEIVTENLEGQIGYLPGKESTEKAPHVALAIFPSTVTNPIAKFECEGEGAMLSIEGCVVGSFSPTNTATKEFTLAFEETTGVQAFLKYEPEKGTEKKCEMKLSNGETIGLHVTTKAKVISCPNMETVKD
jgi:hypothetical protein